MKIKGYFKYFFVVFFLLVVYLAFLTVKPFLSAILAGAVVAYVFYPLYRFVNKFLKSSNLSAFLVSIFIILVITIPAIALVDNIASEARFFYLRAKQKLATGNIFDVQCIEGPACVFVEKLKSVVSAPTFRSYAEEAISRFSNFILGEASELVFALPRLFLNMFVTFFVTFYLFKDGPQLIERLRRVLPIKPNFQKEVFKKIDQIIYAVIYGSIIIALIQGSLGAVAFFAVGISSPLLWGILMSIFALIPFMGTAVIWAPASLFLIIDGLISSHIGLFLRGTGLLLFGAFVISTIDNILKPRLIGAKAEVHPVLVLVGVLGGLVFLGFVGFIIGPLILALFMAFLEIYEKEKNLILR